MIQQARTSASKQQDSSGNRAQRASKTNEPSANQLNNLAFKGESERGFSLASAANKCK